MRWIVFIPLLCLAARTGVAPAAERPAPVHQWGVWEQALRSSRDYANPLWDVSLQVELTSPSGKHRMLEGFWDGERTWRVRFSPDERGRWSWKTACSDAADAGLHGQAGSFECRAYRGRNPLYRHGPLRVSGDGTHFVHQDGTPFFWLADTAWNGPLLAKPADWQRYLDLRRKQKFTGIQFVTTQWRGGDRSLPDRAYSREGDRLKVNPAFFQRLDPKVAAVNQRGLLAVPVLLWALIPTDPGRALPQADAVRLARYTVARWGAHQVAWFLGGDGDFGGPNAERWRRIGRAVFPGERDRLVTLHPGGERWVGSEFREEPWFDFVGYQSGHGGGASSLRWLVAGPPANDWKAEPRRPLVNLEPNYEAHPGLGGGRKYDASHVRRAAYWSMLLHPPAGVSYGHNAVWVWNEQAGPSEGHPRLGTVEPWTTGLQPEGVADMTRLRGYFESGPWTHLRPAPEVVAEQPGTTDPARFIAAASTTDGEWTVVYTPAPGELRLDLSRLQRRVTARWWDPRTGRYTSAGHLEPGRASLRTPGEGDWILDLRR